MRNEILEYFRKANGQFVSGEQISKDLNVSRTAIWKYIKILKSRGYIFESSTRKGYRLIYEPDLLTPLEYSIAMLACRDWTNQEIGEHLGLSVNTVKHYVSGILEKLHIDKREKIKEFVNQ